jgi:hypothetical protein
MKTPAKFGRTMRAAFVRPQEFGEGDGIVKAGELVEATFPDGASLSASARKVLVLLLAHAAGDAWKDREFSISKGDMRGNHKSNERLEPVLSELEAIKLRVRVKSPAGNEAILVAPIIAQRVEECSNDDKALVFFRFSDAMRTVIQQSDYYAELHKQTILSFESRYSVTLYETGCLLYRRQSPSWRGNIQELREKLGVPAGCYRDFTDIRRKTLEPARAEINHIAPFTLDWKEFRRGRAVVEVVLTFTTKEPAQIAAAQAELNRSRVGRKARRAGTVETVQAARRTDGKLVENKSARSLQ